MTTFNKLPLTYDGVRLDTLAYAIESLDGRRMLPRTRSRDVSVPGLHGELPSKYDDYEAGRVFLRMWVRSNDVDGYRVASDAPKKIFFRNLDRLYALFGSKWKLGDLRQQVDMDGFDRTSLIVNPRLDKSTGSTPFRINRIVNPSFESAGSSTTLRTNLIRNPSFETGVLRWTAETGCTISQSAGSLVAGAGSNKCLLTSDGSGNVGIIADSTTAPVVVGQVYTASATVGTFETNPGTHMQILIRWMAPNNTTIVSEVTSDEAVEVDSFNKIGINQPIPQRISVSAAAPVGSGFAKVVVRVVEPNLPVGDEYVVDAVLLEQSATPGDYFDGSFTDLGASWSGTAHDSTSVITEASLNTWGTPSGVTASPSFIASASGFTDAAGSFTITVPATTQEGDMLVLVAGVANETVTLEPSGGTSDSWAQRGYRNTDGTQAGYIWRAFATAASAGSTITVARSAGTGTKMVGIVRVYRNARDLATAQGAGTGAVQTTHATPANTVDEAPTLVLLACTAKSSTLTSMTAPGVNVAIELGVAGGGREGTATSDLAVAAAGAVAAQNFTTDVATQAVSLWSAVILPATAIPASATLTRVGDEGAAFGLYCGQWESLGAISAGTPILWQAGTLPAASAGTQWAGSIYVRTDMEDPPLLILKLAGLDGGGNLVGYGRSGSAAGPDLEIPIRPGEQWWRYPLHNAFMPAGATQVRLQIVAGQDFGTGMVILFDGATLEAVPKTPFYFDGDTDGSGTEFVWQGSVDNSWSEWRLGAVQGWTADANGSLVHDTAADGFPVRGARACGKYTVNVSGSTNYIESTDALFNTPGQTWTSGAYVWGNAGAEMAQITIEARQGTSTVVASASGALATTTGGWTWVPGPELALPVTADRVRMRIRFRKTGDVNPDPSAFARICGAVLTTGPAENLSYFDETTPGAIPGGGGRVRRPPQVRQAIVKTDDAIPAETRILADNSFIAELIVSLKIPATFWQDVYPLTWTSPVQSTTQSRIYEISNFQGCTAPLEDLIFVIYGAGASPRITDPQSGAWVQLNATLPAGQAWRFDAGRWLSGRGAISLAPTSSAWGDAISITSSTGPRARFSVHPEWNEEIQDHIVRVQLTRASKLVVVGRRKYL